MHREEYCPTVFLVLYNNNTNLIYYNFAVGHYYSKSYRGNASCNKRMSRRHYVPDRVDIILLNGFTLRTLRRQLRH